MPAANTAKMSRAPSFTDQIDDKRRQIPQSALLLKQVTYPHVQSSLVSKDLPAH